MEFFNSPVARRTRSQWLLFYQGFCGSSTSRDQPRKRNREVQVLSEGGSGQDIHQVIDVDEYHSVNKRASKRKANRNGSEGSSRSTTELSEDKIVDETSFDESAEQKSNENGSRDSSGFDIESSSDESEEEEDDYEESEVIEKIEFVKPAMKNRCCGSAVPFKTGTHTYFLYSSDDSDDTDASPEDEEEVDEDLQTFSKDVHESPNDTDVILVDEEEVDEGLQTVYKDVHGSQNDVKPCPDQSVQADESDSEESSTENESESDRSDDLDFALPKKRSNQPKNPKQSLTKNMKEKMFTVDRLQENHSRPKTNMKVNQNVTEGSVDAILDSIIRNGSGHHEEGHDRVPLSFRFDDSEDESSSQKTDESDAEALLQEMNFMLKCEEIGSYRTLAVDNDEEDDTEATDVNLCEKGDHIDVYLEDQTGLRCRLCGAVLLESRYVIPTLANYAPDKSRRSYIYDEQQQFSSLEDMYSKISYLSRFDICDKMKGTVWELVPINIRVHLYPHQQEGFEFIWKALAGTIELSRLQKRESCSLGHGGCIISHAPGTGKTFLTIVFIGSFLKRYPNCCPILVAPANMLLTWEAEFKKWRVGFLFISLNNVEFSSKDDSRLKLNKNLIRAMKISSWSNGGSVLGVSYNLYEKLAGTRNTNLEKMGNLLLDLPGLVVLDEGHTPRNQGSNIWNVLLKLKTKNRIILSGTPFQNNFGELFNTLRLVRPSIAIDIMKEKVFADMIHQKRRKFRGSGSASEGIEKLKSIISPFVHVHKGNILENKLRGLKQSIIILNPPPFQKRFLENLGCLAKTFEYEHKVALVSLHPALILHCSLSEEEENSVNKQELEKVRLDPDLGVKTRFVIELIRLSVSLNEKVLIFSQYIQPLELLKDQISSVFDWDVGREVVVVKGRIHQNQRQTIINEFNDPKNEMKVLLASTKCCSEGIHLIGASRVVLLDVVWNPSVERQAISRAYRLGQKKVVYTYHLLASGTTEEEKYDRQMEKGRLAEMVISSCAMDAEKTKKNESEAYTDTIELNDEILQQIVCHQRLKHMFKEIRYPDDQTKI